MLKKSCINGAAILVLMVGFLLQPAAAAQARRRQPSPPAVVEKPLTIDNVILLVQKVAIERALDILRRRGIDFIATDENMRRLAEVNAPKDIVDEVRKESEAKEKTLPAKVVKTDLKLLVVCVPAECEIRLNDKPFGTDKGQITFDNLNPEAYKVTAWREGYEIEKDLVDMRSVKAGEVKRQEFQLKPTEVRQGKWGDTLLQGMLATAKISRDPKQVSGVLTIKEAQTVQWNVVAHITAPGAAELEMSSSQVHLNVSCLDGGCQISTAKGGLLKRSGFSGSKQEKMLQEQFLLRHTERWLANEYDSFILRLTGVRVNSTSKTDPESAPPKEFQAGTNAGAYTISLDENMRPALVKFAAAAGLTGATVVTYSNFQGAYPALTEIRFTDNEKQFMSFAAKGIDSSGGNAAPKK